MENIHLNCASSTAGGAESRSLQLLPALSRAVSSSLELQQAALVTLLGWDGCALSLCLIPVPELFRWVALGLRGTRLLFARTSLCS